MLSRRFARCAISHQKSSHGPQHRFSSTASAAAAAIPKHVLNIFNGRVIKSDSPMVKSLLDMGFAIQRGGSELAAGKIVLQDRAKFNAFAAELRNGTVELPTAWTKAMADSLAFIMRNGDVADPAAQATQWMTNLERRVRSRRAAGTVTAGDGDASVHPEDEAVQLTAEQEEVIKHARAGWNLFISGNAGTGKTALLRALRRALAKERLAVGMCATTGIAGCHVGGATFHHTLCVTTHNEFTSAKNLLKFDVIIIDEISMMTRELFEAFDAQLRAATGSAAPFGGVQIILCGDFLQLGAIPYTPLFKSPVFQRGFLSVRLTQQVRQSKHAEFAALLQQLRKGTAPKRLRDVVRCHDEAFLADDAVNLLPTNEQVNEANRKELERLPGEAVTFSPFIQPPELQQTWTKTAILKTDGGFNAHFFVEQFVRLMTSRVRFAPNMVCLYQLYSDGFVLRVRLSGNEPEAWRTAVSRHFEDAVRDIGVHHLGCTLDQLLDDGNGLQTPDDEEMLAKMVRKHPVVEPFELKVGARVLLRANLSREFVNGSVGTVVDFVDCAEENVDPRFVTDAVRAQLEQYVHEMQFINCSETLPLLPVVQFGGPDGKKIAIPPWRFTVGGDASTNFYGVSALCLPLSLAYAFTVHRVQGLTLVGRVHLELSRMWPCEHLLYVAMSRVRTPDQLTLSCFRDEMVLADPEAVAFDEQIPAVREVLVPRHLRPALWKQLGETARAAKGRSSAVQLTAKSHARGGADVGKAMRQVAKSMARMQEARSARLAAKLAQEQQQQQREELGTAGSTGSDVSQTAR